MCINRIKHIYLRKDLERLIIIMTSIDFLWSHRNTLVCYFPIDTVGHTMSNFYVEKTVFTIL